MLRLGSSAFVPIALVVGLVACRGESFQGTGAAAGEGGSGATAAGGAGGAAGGGVATGGGGAGAGTQGGGGSGGEAPTEEIVEVRYGDEHAPLTGRVLLVSDATGAPIDETVIDVKGKATVTVPHGGFVTVLEDETPGAFTVYSAQVVPGVTAVRLVRSTALVSNDHQSQLLSIRGINCLSCVAGDRVEFHRSCEPVLVATVGAGPAQTQSMPSPTDGCSGVAKLEVSAIAYSTDGIPKAGGTAQTTFPLSTNQMIDVQLAPLPANDVVYLNVPITLGVSGYEVGEREVRDLDPIDRVPHRTWQPVGGIGLQTFVLPKSLASQLRVLRGVKNDAFNTTIVRRQDHNVETQLGPFGVDSLALPEDPEPLDFADPLQPKWSYALGNDTPRAGVALLAFAGPTTWNVLVPANASAEISLPKLPEEYADFRLPAADLNQVVVHLALGPQDDYQALAAGGVNLTGDSPWFPEITMAADSTF